MIMSFDLPGDLPKPVEEQYAPPEEWACDHCGQGPIYERDLLLCPRCEYSVGPKCWPTEPSPSGAPWSVCKHCVKEIRDEQQGDFDRWMQEQNCDPSGRPWGGWK